MEVHLRKLKQREKDELMLRKRDEGGSRAVALKAFTKRDLVFAFRTWRVSAWRVHGVCMACASRVRGVCATCERPSSARGRAMEKRGGARRDGSGSRWGAGTSSSTPTRGASCPRRWARCGGRSLSLS